METDSRSITNKHEEKQSRTIAIVRTAYQKGDQQQTTEPSLKSTSKTEGDLSCYHGVSGASHTPRASRDDRSYL